MDKKQHTLQKLTSLMNSSVWLVEQEKQKFQKKIEQLEYQHRTQQQQVNNIKNQYTAMTQQGESLSLQHISNLFASLDKLQQAQAGTKTQLSQHNQQLGKLKNQQQKQKTTLKQYNKLNERYQLKHNQHVQKQYEQQADEWAVSAQFMNQTD